jgi:hypothetical protein
MRSEIAREADGWYVPLATAVQLMRRVLPCRRAGPGDSCLLSAAPLPVVDARGNRIRKPLQP